MFLWIKYLVTLTHLNLCGFSAFIFSNISFNGVYISFKNSPLSDIVLLSIFSECLSSLHISNYLDIVQLMPQFTDIHFFDSAILHPAKMPLSIDTIFSSVFFFFLHPIEKQLFIDTYFGLVVQHHRMTNMVQLMPLFPTHFWFGFLALA